LAVELREQVEKERQGGLLALGDEFAERDAHALVPVAHGGGDTPTAPRQLEVHGAGVVASGAAANQALALERRYRIRHGGLAHVELRRQRPDAAPLDRLRRQAEEHSRLRGGEARGARAAAQLGVERVAGAIEGPDELRVEALGIRLPSGHQCPSA
jgi:hypothetical protein